MREIELPCGRFCIVDNLDFYWLQQYKWRVKKRYGERAKNQKDISVQAKINGQTIVMARLILGLKVGEKLVVRHKNGNKLDNRRVNIEIMTHVEKQYTRIPQKRKTNNPFKGVYAHGNKYKAMTQVSGKIGYIGLFDTAIEAAIAYDERIVQVSGEMAMTNYKLGLLSDKPSNN